MADKEVNRYLIIIRIGEKQPDRERLHDACPAIKDALRRCSIDDPQLAFNSHDGATFGMLLKSNHHPKAIRAILRGTTGRHSAVLLNEDSTIVVQLGKESACAGFGRTAAWLQHN